MLAASNAETQFKFLPVRVTELEAMMADMTNTELSTRDDLQSWLFVMQSETQCWECRTAPAINLQALYDAATDVDSFAVSAADRLLADGWNMRDNRPHCDRCNGIAGSARGICTGR